jgi:hypothetical protein
MIQIEQDSQGIVRLRVDEMELHRLSSVGWLLVGLRTLPPTGARPVLQSKASSQSQGDAVGFDFANPGLLSVIGRNKALFWSKELDNSADLSQKCEQRL